jgi:hypothetical protein
LLKQANQSGSHQLMVIHNKYFDHAHPPSENNNSKKPLKNPFRNPLQNPLQNAPSNGPIKKQRKTWTTLQQDTLD